MSAICTDFKWPAGFKFAAPGQVTFVPKFAAPGQVTFVLKFAAPGQVTFVPKFAAPRVVICCTMPRILRPHDAYATTVYWKGALEPSLKKLGLTFEEIYVVAELDKYEHYIGFVRTSKRGISVWVSVFVTFIKRKVDISLDSPVSEEEMMSWNEGKFLLDKRPFILTQ